jgi:antirestriction protein ArdC
MKQVATLREEVLEAVITLLEKGVKPWCQPWVDGNEGACLPYNLKTTQPYRGINALWLWVAGRSRGFGSEAWLTYDQAKALGGNVRKNERGVHCFCFSIKEEVDKATGEIIKYPFSNTFVLFNREQIDGKLSTKEEPIEFTPIEKAEALIEESMAVVVEGGDSAFYSRTKDFICVPKRTSFITVEAYYATVLHELTHWSGHANRLDRHSKIKKYADMDYAFEELVAEMGSAFLCASLGIASDLTSHASYIDGWLKILAQDKQAFFQAAALANRASKYLLSTIDAYQSNVMEVAA